MVNNGVAVSGLPPGDGNVVKVRFPRVVADPGQDEVVQNLLRALVRRVAEIGGPPTSDRPVLDREELGVRCLLLPRDIRPGGVAGLLSPREREIARMVALGRTNRAIADSLDISNYTVSTHLRRVFAKLDVTSRAAMVASLAGNPHLLAEK